MFDSAKPVSNCESIERGKWEFTEDECSASMLCRYFNIHGLIVAVNIALKVGWRKSF